MYSMRRDMLGCHSLSHPVIPISANLTAKNHQENGKLKAGYPWPVGRKGDWQSQRLGYKCSRAETSQRPGLELGKIHQDIDANLSCRRSKIDSISDS